MRSDLSKPYYGSYYFRISVLLLTLMSVNGCNSQGNNLDNDSQKTFGSGHYKINHPDQVFMLPYELEEISGLAHFKDSVAVAVQDEKGKLYFYDYNKGELLDEFTFGGDGDYEGIVLADSIIYITKSNGDLYALNINTKLTEYIKTPLKLNNDIEGLAYITERNQLIFACKESSEVGDESPKGKGFYGYDISSNQFISSPLFSITRNQLSEVLNKKVKEFKPSGIAIHPITKDIYVLAHAGKLLVRLSKMYEVKEVMSLKGSLFRQPEGICFTPQGDLLISNEGDGGRGTLLYYHYDSAK